MTQLPNLLAILCFGASVCVAANPVPWGACKTVPQMAHPKLLGTIDGHRVYDSVAFRGPRLMSYAEIYKKQLPDQPWIKRVFVERNPDEFCEIYRISNEEDNFDYSPTKIVLISGRPVIASLCNLVTNHGPFEQRYFFLNKDGRAVRLPIESLVYGAIQSATKTADLKDFFLIPNRQLSLSTFSFETQVYRKTDAACCPTGGSVCLRFRFQGDDVLVAKKQYDPDTNAKWTATCSKSQR